MCVLSDSTYEYICHSTPDSISNPAGSIPRHPHVQITFFLLIYKTENEHLQKNYATSQKITQDLIHIQNKRY